MKNRSRKRPHGKPSAVLGVIRAALIGCGAVVAAVSAMTLLLYWGVLNEDAVSIVNAVLKVLGAVTSGVIAVRGEPPRAWLCGGLAAVLFALLTTAVMCLLAGELALHIGLLGDLLMSFACGSAAAPICRMLKRKNAA